MSLNKDRITELPEAILHHIIYFLHQLDESLVNFNSVAHFSISSKAFYHAYISSPHLSYVQPKVDDTKTFVKGVDQSLERAVSQGLTIDTFKLDIFDIKPKYITRWVERVSPLRVKVIHLHFQDGCKFLVTMTLFHDIMSLEELSLTRCLLKLRERWEDGKGVTRVQRCYGEYLELTSREGAVKLPCLKRLKLASVKLTTHSETLAGIFRECPLLEHFEMISMAIPSLQIPYLSNLKTVVIGRDVYMKQEYPSKPLTEMIIDAPCLTEFSCAWNCRHMPCFNFASWSGLKKLRLNGEHELSNLFLEDLLTHLTQLEYLSIGYFQSLEDPLISSPSIRHLKLVQCEISGTLRIGCPNLCSFSYHCNKVPTIHQESSCSRHWKLDLYLYDLGCQYYLHKDMFVTDMSKFLSDTSIDISCLRVDVADLYSNNTTRSGFNEERMAEKQMSGPRPLPVKLKWLKLDIFNCESFPWDILDTFLWMLRPELVSLSFHGDHKDKVLQSMSNMVVKTKARLKCACSDSRELGKCWHHTLRDTMFEWLKISDGSETAWNFESLDMNDICQHTKQLSYSADLSVCFRFWWEEDSNITS